MNIDDYFCIWKLDPRDTAIQDRLQQYYDETPDHVCNREAWKRWVEFKRWCAERGYTREDINRAKRAKRYD